MNRYGELLDEVARLVLGLVQAPGEQASLSKGDLKKFLKELPRFYSGMPLASPVLGEVLLGPSPPKRLEGEQENPNAGSPGEPAKIGSVQGIPNPDLSRKLREWEKKFNKKVHEVEELKRKLQREEQLRKEEERDKGKALEQVAHLKRELKELEETKERLKVELGRAQHELGELKEEWEKLRLESQALRDRNTEYEQQLEQLTSKVQSLEKELEDKKHLEARLARLTQLRQTLPEPFPQEVLLRILVLDYPSLGDDPGDRLIALIDGYRALLVGEPHPALEHSNLDLLAREPEGVVLLGLEQLLLDLTHLPLARWLRAHGFRLEAFLQQESPLTSPRLSEER